MKKVKLLVLSALLACGSVLTAKAEDLKKSLIVTVKAQPGKGDQALAYLASQKPLDIVAKEKKTMTWYFFRSEDDKDTFYVVDTFKTDEGRNEHIAGAIPKAVAAKPDLFLPLEVKKMEVVLVAKPKK